jgi:hypothetical protein
MEYKRELAVKTKIAVVQISYFLPVILDDVSVEPPSPNSGILLRLFAVTIAGFISMMLLVPLRLF